MLNSTRGINCKPPSFGLMYIARNYWVYSCPYSHIVLVRCNMVSFFTQMCAKPTGDKINFRTALERCPVYACVGLLTTAIQII